MDRFVALYRGINVGGNRPVKMESLRWMHERLGHREVASYIQSGNVVFSTGGSARTIAARTAAAFADEFGFASHVIVVSAERWRALIRENPYAGEARELSRAVHAGLCEGTPDRAALGALLERTRGRERFSVNGGIVYLHAPDGTGTSKFAAGMERACGVPITVRNWRTIEAIGLLLGDPAPARPRSGVGNPGRRRERPRPRA